METVDTKIQIYCLKHPITLEVRYVGMTSRTLKRRLQGHIDNAKYTGHNKHLCSWILSILKLNMKPIIESIDEVTLENWQEKERYYISLYPRLINATLGGEGTFGFKHSIETIERVRLKKIGIKPSKETLLKRSIALKGRIVTQDHRDKISVKNTGKIYTKFKILVKDIISKEETVCNTVKEVKAMFKMGEMTVRRNLNKDSIVKKRYILVKI